MDAELLAKRLEREKRARAEAERLLEERSTSLYGALQRAEQESERRRLSENQLTNAIENMSEGFVIYDAEDRFVLCNSRNRAIFEGTADLFQPGAHIADILRQSAERGQYEDYADDPNGWLKQRLAKFHDANDVFVEKLSSGQWIQSRDRKTSDGRTIGVRTDITDLMNREHQLRVSEERFRSITESASDAIIAFDGTGHIVSWNQGAVRILGYAPDEAAATSLFDMIAEMDRDTFRNILDRCAERGVNSWQEGAQKIVCIAKSGQEVPTEATVSSWKTANGECFGIIMRDISGRILQEQEREQLERQLRHMQKMESLGTLAGGTAHEFNNMLVPMIGLTEIVLEDLPQDSVERENLQMVLEAGSRAKSLVKKILSFSREQPRETDAIDIRATLLNALDLVRNTLPSTIAIRENIQEGEMIVWADPTEFHQIIMNLATNAAHAINGEVGQIDFCLDVVAPDRTAPQQSHSFVSLRIRDTGCGMDEATRERMFEPFFTTKSVGEGTGLGLAMIHAIVTRLEGTIAVDSAPGEGTEFDIRLPMISTAMSDKQGTLEDTGPLALSA